MGSSSTSLPFRSSSISHTGLGGHLRAGGGPDSAVGSGRSLRSSSKSHIGRSERARGADRGRGGVGSRVLGSPSSPSAASGLSFAFAETGCLAFRARRRSLRCTELQLCANGEGAGTVVAEGLVERRLDLSEAGQILKLFGGLGDSCETLAEDSSQPLLQRRRPEKRATLA